MRINQVVIETGLTKKAINYYEEQGLINVKKDENSYRVYTPEHIKVLKEIALYRKLDISIGNINKILEAKDKKLILDKTLKEKESEVVKTKIQQKYIEDLIRSNVGEEDIRLIDEEFNQWENKRGEFIKNELVRAFPTGLGMILSIHFAPYLNESLDTEEKYKAWINIIEFLDNSDDITVPEELKKHYESLSEKDLEVFTHTNKKLMEFSYANEKELEEHKKVIMETVKNTESILNSDDDSIKKALESVNKLKTQLKNFFHSSGYYEVFIPNMKVLSKDYKEYHEKLNKLNDKLTKELGIGYDKNNNIVRI